VVLIALNPWHMQHQALGYCTFVNFAFCPWIIYFLLDDRKRVSSLLLAAACTSLIVYQGSLHIFNWLMLSAGLYVLAWAACDWRGALANVRWLLSFLGLTVAIALPKLFAIASSLESFRRPIAQSYQSFGDLGGILTDTVVNPYQASATPAT